MMRCSIKLIVPISFLLIVCSLSGCSNSEQKRSEEYFIKVGGRGITVSDFNTAFEIAKAAYSYNSVRQPGTLREARLRLIGQMIEEMLVLERAKELGIEI
ncbi:MAG: SurA N-terminal domain-containing protein, partial [Deltaproteobacteria bacterium]|nr:SurA N-terminal domain-containing protein [Deltaproteobacteria bacterium]